MKKLLSKKPKTKTKTKAEPKVSWQHIQIDDSIDTAAMKFFAENKKESRSSLASAALKQFLTKAGFLEKNAAVKLLKNTK